MKKATGSVGMSGIRGAYPYYMERFFEENGIAIVGKTEDADHFKKGLCGFFQFQLLYFALL